MVTPPLVTVPRNPLAAIPSKEQIGAMQRAALIERLTNPARSHGRIRPAPVETEVVTKSFTIASQFPALWASLTDLERSFLRREKFIYGAMPGAVEPTLPAEVTPLAVAAAALTGTTHHPASRAALDTLLNSLGNTLHVGDTIVLTAGVEYGTALILPPRTDTGWIKITTSDEASLPLRGASTVPGTLLTPSHKSHMARFTRQYWVETVTISIPDGSRGWWICGLEFKMPEDTPQNNNRTFGYISIGGTSFDRTVPRAHDVIIERCYMHAKDDPTIWLEFGKAIILSGYNVQVHDCYIVDCQSGVETQCILICNSHGPVLVQNCELQGAGQNILIYQSDEAKIDGYWSDPAGHYMNPAVSGTRDMIDCIASDITIRHNHIYKPLRWKHSSPQTDGSNWTVKQLLECKHGERIHIVGNLLENNWGGFGQDGPLTGFTAQFTKDVTYEYNIIVAEDGHYIWGGADGNPREFSPPSPSRNSVFDVLVVNGQNVGLDYDGSALAYARYVDPLDPAGSNNRMYRRQRIKIFNNLYFLGSDSTNENAGQWLKYARGADDVWAEHNTIVWYGIAPASAGAIVIETGPTTVDYQNFNGAPVWTYDNTSHRNTLRSNIIFMAQRLMTGDGTGELQTDAGLQLDTRFPDRDFQANVIYGGSQGDWNTAWARVYASQAAIGLNNDGSLASGSPCKAGQIGQAHDSTDNGVNFTMLAIRQADSGGGSGNLFGISAGDTALLTEQLARVAQGLLIRRVKGFRATSRKVLP